MNRDLIENFQVLQTYFRGEGDRGRTIAYGKIITIIRSLNFEVTKVSQLNNIRGIGPKAKAKVKEFLDTGRMRAVEEKKKIARKIVIGNKKEGVIHKLATVWGIGPAKAKKLYDEGIRKVSDLKKHKDLLTAQQRIGLKHHSDLLLKIPRKFITALATVISYYLNRKYGTDSYQMKVAGSYRRKAPESGDMDCLMSSDKFGLKDMVEMLRKRGVITDILSMKDQKFMGIARCPGGGQHIRLDIEFVPEDEWGTSLTYFTGSKGFNVYMRGIAKRKGYLLNEHGLFSIQTGKKVIESPTEHDIFTVLDMEYVPPERR